MNRASHIMVDLETLDTLPTAVILSIGACKVNLDTGEITDEFYRVVNAESCKAIGMTVSASTQAWWAKQSEEARKVFTDPSVSIQQAMQEFATYLRFHGTSTLKLWGNGSDFDNTILANACARMGVSTPWRFYNNRCFRTVRKGLGHLIQEPPRPGTYHNALDDAKYQAQILALLGKWIQE